VIRYAAALAEAAEPTTGEVQVDFFTQPSLGADPHAIAIDQNPNHQGWVN